ncbi:hypothetical protein D3C81_1512380 [compost metagenome]
MAQKVLQECLVLQRRLQFRGLLQRLVVGVDGGLQFALPGQRIAAVVMVGSLVALAEGLCRGGIVAGPVEGQAAPAEVFEMVGGFPRPVCVEQVSALLVCAQPEIGELEGVGRLRRGPQRGQQRQAEQPAAAAGAGGEQQQRQQQPVALVGPALQEQHGVFCALQAAGTVQQAKGAEVAEAGNQTLVAGVQRAGEAPQPGLV